MAWKFFTKDGAEKRVAASVVNPQATIYHNAPQSIPNSAQTTLSFNTVLSDTASMTATANKITITKAGRYLLEASAEYAANATGVRQLFFVINGNSSPIAQMVPATAAGTTQLTVSATVDLAAGDQITTAVSQTSGGALNVSAAGLTNLYACSFAATKIDGAVVSYVGVPGSLVGQELAYVEFTGVVSSTTATEAAPLDIVATGSVTYDGVTPVLVEFFCPSTITGGTAAVGINLWEDSTDKGRFFDGQGQAVVGGHSSYKRKYIPSAGAHVLKARLWTSAANNFQLSAGAGGVGTRLPGFIRVTRAA